MQNLSMSVTAVSIDCNFAFYRYSREIKLVATAA
jgi:hypothetical protein